MERGLQRQTHGAEAKGRLSGTSEQPKMIFDWKHSLSSSAELGGVKLRLREEKDGKHGEGGDECCVSEKMSYLHSIGEII